MISTGITGTARHGMKPNSASSSLVKTLARAAPPRERIACARPRHVRRVDGIADHLEREIGLHARAHVEVAVVEQRPAAVLRALRPPQIDRDLALQLGIDRLAEIVAQQHVFGGNGGVGLELEAPVAVRAAGNRAAPASPPRCCGRDSARSAVMPLRLRSSTTSAARLPDRTALSKRRRQAGRGPVAGQNEIAPLRPRGGTLGVLLRGGREGRPPLAHDLPRRQFGGNSRQPATPPARSSAPASRAARPSGGRHC